MEPEKKNSLQRHRRETEVRPTNMTLYSCETELKILTMTELDTEFLDTSNFRNNSGYFPASSLEENRRQSMTAVYQHERFPPLNITSCNSLTDLDHWVCPTVNLLVVQHWLHRPYIEQPLPSTLNYLSSLSHELAMNVHSNSVNTSVSARSLRAVSACLSLDIYRPQLLGISKWNDVNTCNLLTLVYNVGSKGTQNALKKQKKKKKSIPYDRCSKLKFFRKSVCVCVAQCVPYLHRERERWQREKKKSLTYKYYLIAVVKFDWIEETTLLILKVTDNLVLL